MSRRPRLSERLFPYWGPLRIVVAIAVAAAIIGAGLRLMSWSN